MPNTEVKHFNGEDSWACPCENSKLPVFFVLLNKASVLSEYGGFYCANFNSKRMDDIITLISIRFSMEEL